MQHEQGGLLQALTLRWDVRKQLAILSWAVASKTMRGIVRPVT